MSLESFRSEWKDDDEARKKAREEKEELGRKKAALEKMKNIMKIENCEIIDEDQEDWTSSIQDEETKVKKDYKIKEQTEEEKLEDLKEKKAKAEKDIGKAKEKLTKIEKLGQENNIPVSRSVGEVNEKIKELEIERDSIDEAIKDALSKSQDEST